MSDIFCNMTLPNGNNVQLLDLAGGFKRLIFVDNHGREIPIPNGFDMKYVSGCEKGTRVGRIDNSFILGATSITPTMALTHNGAEVARIENTCVTTMNLV